MKYTVIPGLIQCCIEETAGGYCQLRHLHSVRWDKYYSIPLTPTVGGNCNHYHFSLLKFHIFPNILSSKMRYRPIGLLLWFFLTLVLCAVDIGDEKAPQGDLQVALDYSLASTWPRRRGVSSRDARNFFWSSHLTFNNPVSGIGGISDEQLWKIAFDAYNEIEGDLQQYGLSEDEWPRSLSVLAWGNEIILASGQKGDNSFSYQGPRTKVLQSLQRCQVTYLQQNPGTRRSLHRRKGKCAEQMAAHLYYFSPSTQESNTELPSQNARIGTVVYRSSEERVVQERPCGDNPKVSQHYLLFWPVSKLMLMKLWRLSGAAIYLWAIKNWYPSTPPLFQRNITCKSLLVGWPGRTKSNYVVLSDTFKCCDLLSRGTYKTMWYKFGAPRIILESNICMT